MTLRPISLRRSHSDHRGADHRSADESGAAIILVLALLVIVAVMALAFLARTRTELITADISGRALAARRMAQLAADTVQVQILEATTRTQVAPVWASQPGMIRTFTKEGEPSEFYKLYSDETMVTSGDGFDPNTEDAVPQDWEQAIAEYTDLNAPEGRRYPIADPTSASGETAVTGFSIADDESVPKGSTGELPMPAKWLYALEDGTLVAPERQSFGQDARGRPIQKVRVPGASETNKIVGRVAFWTDDETSKVNVNTAVGSSPLDPDAPGGFHATPSFVTEFDQKRLVDNAPVEGEYQRYRGHPASVSLGTVFPTLTNDELADLGPRASGEGSRGGVFKTDATVPLDVATERLYATVDELAFTARRLEAPKMDSREINQKRFFLTTRSSSPDLTPFGTPKISLVPDDIEGATSDLPTVAAERKLAAFSATLRPRSGGGFTEQPYHFSRSDALDPDADFKLDRNVVLYDYLQRMLESEVPGFPGKPFPEKFGERNTRQIGISIYDMIRSSQLTGSNFAPNGIVYPTKDLKDEDGPIAGYGRMEILTEFGIALIPVQMPSPSRVLAAAITDDEDPNPKKELFDVREYRAIALWEAFVPGQGYPAYGQDFGVRIQGLDRVGIHFNEGWVAPNLTSKLTSKTIALFPPEANAEMAFDTPSTGIVAAQRGWGGVIPPSVPLIESATGKVRKLSHGTGTEATERYPFFGESIFVYFPVAKGKKPEQHEFELGAFTAGARPSSKSQVPVFIDYLSSKEEGKVIARYRADIGGVPPLPDEVPDFLKAVAGLVDVPPIAFPADSGSNVKIETRLQNILFEEQGAENVAWQDLIETNDVVRTYQPLAALDGGALFGGDLRLFGPRVFSGVPVPPYQPRIDSLITAPGKTLADHRCLHSFGTNTGFVYPLQNPYFTSPGTTDRRALGFSPLVPGLRSEYEGFEIPEIWPDGDAAKLYMTPWSNVVDGSVALIPRAGDPEPGDWDSGVGLARPGPYLNFPDEGHYISGSEPGAAYLDPFVPDGAPRSGAITPGASFPSAVMFGSLPTGVYAESGIPERPWETLLFNPGPASGSQHFSQLVESPAEGEGMVPDHALLEFFRMPVVRPYALSFPASSSGRVNLNSQILPFTYIRRETALHAALAAERVTLVPAGALSSFKGQLSGDVIPGSAHVRIDAAVTLQGIRARFEEGDIYRFPSEICDIFLVPEEFGIEEYDETTLVPFWQSTNINGLVGDNERERPYASLYPKLTTRSNSYVVHVRAQVLRKVRSTDPDVFDSERDVVGGEWRGSFHLERALPPSEPGIPDYALKPTFPVGDPGLPSLEEFHRIRIERVERFSPAFADEKNRRRRQSGGLEGIL